jgi:hypothetical protein
MPIEMRHGFATFNRSTGPDCYSGQIAPTAPQEVQSELGGTTKLLTAIESIELPELVGLANAVISYPCVEAYLQRDAPHFVPHWLPAEKMSIRLIFQGDHANYENIAVPYTYHAAAYNSSAVPFHENEYFYGVPGQAAPNIADHAYRIVCLSSGLLVTAGRHSVEEHDKVTATVHQNDSRQQWTVERMPVSDGGYFRILSHSQNALQVLNKIARQGPPTSAHYQQFRIVPCGRPNVYWIISRASGKALRAFSAASGSTIDEGDRNEHEHSLWKIVRV